jgi:hypothetical protein
MTTLIINKVLIILLVMSILNIIRHSFFIIQIWIKEDSNKYMITTPNLIVLGLSIAYIVSTLFLGLTI